MQKNTISLRPGMVFFKKDLIIKLLGYNKKEKCYNYTDLIVNENGFFEELPFLGKIQKDELLQMEYLSIEGTPIRI